MAFVTAPLVSPTTAESFYGIGTTHTYSLAGVSGFGATAPEIVETARALKNDPDLIYEFVHNQVEVEFAFGERKGPVGALIDKSGTVFDQNALFVALVRAGPTPPAVRYQIGRATITGGAFAAWTGVSDIQAACRMLASGGIPAAFNGATSSPSDCSVSGAFNSVTLLHVWSQVQIGGIWYAYDPSFKSYTTPTPLALLTGAGITSGAAANAATTGMTSGSQSGASFIKNLSNASLNSYLTARGTQLLGWLRTNAPALDTDTVLGLGKIIPAYKPVGGWRNTSPPGYTSIADFTVTGDIPDGWRTKFSVAMAVGSTNALSWPFFVDDIDGRRIGIDTNFDQAHNINPAAYFNNGTLTPRNYTTAVNSIVVDDTVVQSWSCTVNFTSCMGGLSPGTITLVVNHPYAAGGFADQTIVRGLSATAAPVAIVAGFGRLSPARLAKWNDEAPTDKELPDNGTPPWVCNSEGDYCTEDYPQPAGDATRQHLAASWLAQMTRMIREQAAVGGAVAEHHHSIGVIDWRHQLQGYLYPPATSYGPDYFGIQDEFTAMDIDSVVSVTSMTDSAPAVAAISRSIALSSATLEGSVFEQMEDLPDTSSTASRFAWGNNPGADLDGNTPAYSEDPCFTSNNPRPFFDFTGTTSRSSLYEYEGTSGGCGAAPTISGATPSTYVTNAETAISSYLAAGYHVSASAETFLGPGARFGAAHGDIGMGTAYSDPSQQRGAAIVATLFNGAVVTKVAHVLTNVSLANGYALSTLSKGGGGKSPTRFEEYDPNKAADVLKDRFVDRSVALGVDLKSGAAGYTTPTLLSIGAGSTPYKLDYALAFKAAPNGCTTYGPCTGPIQGGWNQTWDVRIANSGSGLEAMGATSPFAAASTLTAYMVMQDTFNLAAANLNQDVVGALTADWWRQQMVDNTVTINRGFSGAQYIRLADNTWLWPIGSPGTLVQSNTQMKFRDHCGMYDTHAYPYSLSRRWDHTNVYFTLTNASGDTLTTASWKWGYDPEQRCAIVYGYKPVNWIWPQGPSLAFTYDYQQGVTGITTTVTAGAGRTMTFNGAAGFSISATANGVTVGQSATASGAITDSDGDAWNFNYTSAMARTATQRPVPYAELSQVFEPVSAMLPALQYSYDTRGLVNGAKDATALQWGTRGAYAWYLATGGRGERDDPLGGAYTVYYDTDGDAVRNIDELGREVDSVWDGRHRVTSRTYPETDQDQFGYDTNDNTVSLIKQPKTGSTLTPITISASYGAWDKLASITDAMGNVTTFSYYGVGQTGASLMSQAVRPAVGGVSPTFTFAYNASGLLTQSVDPAGITATHAYDNLGNLTSTTEGAAATGANWGFTWGVPRWGPLAAALNLTTTFTPDSWGNVTAMVDPRGNATTTQYDNMRRKTAEQDRNGGASALPLMAKTWIYDANGRQTAENRATGFDGSGNPTGYQSWLTAYTPTGKIRQTTDPLGHVTVSGYDAVDRPNQTTDASGRVTATVYDVAGEATAMQRGVGTPLLQTYAAFTYWPDGEKKSVTDANDNTIALNYDGVNRVASIVHPDATSETSQYDPDGDLTIWTNRGGYAIVRCYDVLNRKLSESGITGASNSGACPTGGTANGTSIGARTFAYDPAGRLSVANVVGLAESWVYDAAGRPTSRGGSWATGYAWDGAGNLASVTYTDGSVFTYSFDALDRTTAALSGANTLASLGYDALGRRTILSFGDGSSQTYGYDNADRVTSIAHAFTNSADNVTLGYSYDDGGRELNRTTSNSGYAYSPPVATTAYGAANALNQYPSVGGTSQTWWPQGEVQYGVGFLFYYLETEQMVYAYGSTTPGQPDPNNVQYRSYDALGHLYLHQTHPAANTAYPIIYHSTDGLRQETVLDWQFLENAAGTGSTFQGYRRYVLGPNPDERWAFQDLDNSFYYPHTDREGTTIALSKSGATTTKFHYGAYGESTDPIVDLGPGPASYAYRYTGQRLDPGTGLYDYKARDYSPALGRFLQPDPAGLDAGPNLYAYVGNDPLAGGDPGGECPHFISGCDEDNGIGSLDPFSTSHFQLLEELSAKSLGEGGATILSVGPVQGGSGHSDLPPTDDVEQGRARMAAEKRHNQGERDSQLLGGAAAVIGTGVVTGLVVASAPELAATLASRCCFAAGTLVRTDHGLQPIEQIKIGDHVLSKDAITGNVAYKAVLALVRPHARQIYNLTLHVGSRRTVFSTTDDHPWRSVTGKWVQTEALRRGDRLLRVRGPPARVTSVLRTNRVEATFNLEVADFHTYFVGRDGLWVHNACGPRDTRPNSVQNKQAGDARQSAERATGQRFTKSQRREFHDRITGNQMSFDKLVQEAIDVLTGK